MSRYQRTRGGIAQLSTDAGVVLAVVGWIAILTGITFYLRGTFALGGRIAVLAAAAVILGSPCLVLLHAARLTHEDKFARAMQTSIVCGLIMLPELFIAYLFATFADPCWDLPSCTHPAPTFAHGAINGGMISLVSAVVLALMVSPLLLGLARRSTPFVHG